MKKNGRGYLKPYKSYVFRGKDPIIDLTRTIVQNSKKSYSEIQAESGVSTSTMYNWFHGATKRPTFACINAVGRACDKTLIWTDLKKGA